MSEPLFALPSDAFSVTSDDCYTPPWVFREMGLVFDLDVASPPGGPWHVPAAAYYTAQDDGLVQPWHGLVWCNPPYSKFRPWAEKWAEHDRGCLMGAYAPESATTPIIFGAADCVAFVSVKFTMPNGDRLKPRHGMFVAFRGVGTEPAERLAASDRFGAVLYGRDAS